MSCGGNKIRLSHAEARAVAHREGGWSLAPPRVVGIERGKRERRGPRDGGPRVSELQWSGLADGDESSQETELRLSVRPDALLGTARVSPVGGDRRSSILPATWDAGHWRDRAACRTVSMEVFFPVGVVGEAEIQIARAKLVCSTCAVRSECLEFALRTNQEYGVWGGADEEERRVLRRRRRAAARLAAAS